MKTVPFPDREPPYIVDSKGILDSKACRMRASSTLGFDHRRASGQRSAACSGRPQFHFAPKAQALCRPVSRSHLAGGASGHGKDVTGAGAGLTRTAEALKGQGKFRYLEVEPHALASAALGKSQQAVKHLLGSSWPNEAATGPLIVVLDEVETLAAYSKPDESGGKPYRRAPGHRCRPGST